MNEHARHSAPEGKAGLRCALGYHTVKAAPRWNDGYYFARCARCRVDLVRTAFSRWHVPQGYRVVWQADPPVSRPDVKLEPEPAFAELPAEVAAAAHQEEPLPPSMDPAATPTDVVEPPAQVPPREKIARSLRGRARLPVEALLEKLRGHPDALPEPAPAPPAPRRPLDWDFMMEPGERRRAPAPDPVPIVEPANGAPPPEGTADAPRPAEMRAGPSIVSRAWLRLSRSAAAAGRRARHNKRLAQAAAAAVILAAVVIGSLWLPRPRPEAAAVPEAAPSIPADPSLSRFDADTRATEPSFVAARALSCRDAPALQARRVRVLGRGASVTVLARDGDWVSLATSAGQCWALGRYVSEPKPL